MHTSGTPELRIGRCLSEGLRTWARHLPVFSAASILVVLVSGISAGLLMGSMYAGLLEMFLKGLRGERLRVWDVFSQVRRFARFFSIMLFVVLLTAVGLVFLLAPGILFGTWCFYVFLLAADQNARLDEAFVESRKAVQRYGFWKHLTLIVIALAAVGGGLLAVQDLVNESAFEPSPLVWLAPVLIQPLGLGILAAAYFRTLEPEARQREHREREFKVMRDELQTAHDMQMGLLPSRSPEVEGYSLAGVCIPANNVGGDYFTYRWLDPGRSRLALVAADVSGKAMEAAITALRFNEMLRYECRERCSPADILDGLNASLDGQIETSTFVTCCIAVLDAKEHRVEIANAGHCLPFHFSSAAGRVVPVELTGYPLGLPAAIRPPEKYGTIQMALSPGDALVLYSDGVVEAQNGKGGFFGEDRFSELLADMVPDAGADRLVRAVVRDVDRFIGSAPRSDDVTVVVLRRMV